MNRSFPHIHKVINRFVYKGIIHPEGEYVGCGKNRNSIKILNNAVENLKLFAFYIFYDVLELSGERWVVCELHFDFIYGVENG